MSHHPTVAAVIVTYNRLEKLKNVLVALEKQTVLPANIIVVDNASTDGTDSFLKSYERTFIHHDKVTFMVKTLANNMGGAGGFSHGMCEAYRSGADYIWVFDDDGYPEPTALQTLLQGYSDARRELGKDIPYACSMVKYIDGSICEMNNPVPSWDWGRLLAKGLNAVLVNSCSFVSVLFPRWVVERFGLPYKEYFIWFDDVEYTLRITRDCPGIEVLDSVVLHDMGSNSSVNFSMIDEKNAWKFAYGIRNQASYRLHHEGFPRYLIFCAKVFKNMHDGKVARKLRHQMYGKLVEAIRFNPKIDYPASR